MNFIKGYYSSYLIDKILSNYVTKLYTTMNEIDGFRDDSGYFDLVGLLLHLRIADGGMGSASIQMIPQVNPSPCNEKGRKRWPESAFSASKFPRMGSAIWNCGKARADFGQLLFLKCFDGFDGFARRPFWLEKFAFLEKHLRENIATSQPNQNVESANHLRTLVSPTKTRDSSRIRARMGPRLPADRPSPESGQVMSSPLRWQSMAFVYTALWRLDHTTGLAL
ncbi:hypothetical protein ACQKWADRAFT_305874 [Trichoderma austrokoningii]